MMWLLLGILAFIYLLTPLAVLVLWLNQNNQDQELAKLREQLAGMAGLTGLRTELTALQRQLTVLDRAQADLTARLAALMATAPPMAEQPAVDLAAAVAEPAPPKIEEAAPVELLPVAVVAAEPPATPATVEPVAEPSPPAIVAATPVEPAPQPAAVEVLPAAPATAEPVAEPATPRPAAPVPVVAATVTAAAAEGPVVPEPKVEVRPEPKPVPAPAPKVEPAVEKPRETKPVPVAPPKVEPAPQKPRETKPAPAVPPVVARAPAPAVAAGAAERRQPGRAAAVPVPPPPPSKPATPTAAGGGHSIEEQLGVRLSVWVGAIALALAGIFLVKYAFDHDWLGPDLRVALSALFGASLVVGGEWARIRRSERIGAGLSAAGIAVLYAAFLAATNLYGLVPPLVGFGLMALTTVVAVGLSLRQGPIIAVIGLIGGFLTPYLVRSDTPSSALPLFLYLLFLQYGLMAVGQRRRWRWLPLVTLAASLGWVVLWLLGAFDPGDAAVLYVFLAASAAGILASGAVDLGGGESSDQLARRVLSYLAVVPSLLLAVVVVSMAGFRPLDWLFLGVLGAGCLGLAWRKPDYEPVAWLAAGVTALLLWVWYTGSLTAATAPGAWFAPIVAGLGALYALGAYAILWRSPTPARWAVLSAGAGLVYFLVGCAWSLDAGLKLQSAAVALGLAAVYICLAAPLSRRRAALAQGPLALAALATVATVFISLAVPLALAREWIAVAWALEVPALVWLARRLEVPVLRLLTWPLIALVTFRLLLNPFVLGYPIGAMPVLNWLVYGYGVPIAAFALAAVWSHRDGDERLSGVLQGLAMTFGFAFLSLEVRHFFRADGLTDFDSDRALLETATYGVVWLAYAAGLLRLGRRVAAPLVSGGGVVLTALGLTAAILGSGVLFSPFLHPFHMGDLPIANWLLYVFGVPAALALVVARELRHTERMPVAAVYAVQSAALFLGWLLSTALVRQGFHGAFLNAGAVTLIESATYSIVWLALGIGLLELGRRLAYRLWELGGLAFVGVGLVAALMGSAYYLSPWLHHTDVGRSILLSWLLYVYGMPAALAFVAGRQLRRSPDMPVAVAYVAHAAGLFLVWYLASSLVRQWFHGPYLNEGPLGLLEAATQSIVWLVLGIGLLELGRRRGDRVPTFGGLAFVGVGLMATLLGAGLYVSPWITHAAVGAWPIANWLLYVFGVPAALAFVAGWQLRRSDAMPLVATYTVQSAGLFFVWLLLMSLVRQGFHGTYLDAGALSLVEAATYGIVSLVLGIGLLELGRRVAYRLWALGGLTFVGVGLLATLLGAGFYVNPWLSHVAVGDWRLLNWLLYVYGVPAALAFVAGRQLRRDEGMPPGATYPVQSAGLLFVWLLLTALVRQWFHGTYLDEGSIGLVEAATYSIVWLVAGLGLLELGRRVGYRLWTLGGVTFATLGLLATLLGSAFWLNPWLSHVAVGSWPLLNWLLYVYGIPAALAFVLAWELRRTEQLPRRAVQLVEATGLFVVWLLVTSLVRQTFHGPFLNQGALDLAESASYCIAWLALGVGLLELGRRTTYRLWALGGLTFVSLGLLALLLGPGMFHNPWLNHLAVGGRPLLNWLPFAYGLPAVLVFLTAWELRRSTTLRVPTAAIVALDALGLFLLFALISSLVRQAFHGPYLDRAGMSFAERNAYSLAWALYGLALLALGIRWRSKLLRYASLAVMVLTVAKVFLYDIGNVGDLYRVFSFLGLGASLFALAWLYQRFVFKTDAPREGPTEVAP